MDYLDSRNFPSVDNIQAEQLANSLNSLLTADYSVSFFTMLAGYQRILADIRKKDQWAAIHDKLRILFMCGKSVPLNGPMVGVTLSIRDSDYFRETARSFGHERSLVAGIEWMATAWNLTFADTGLWMGKTFEPVTRDVLASKTNKDQNTLEKFDPDISRIGRNYFREPADPNLIQALGIPALTNLWHLKDRPLTTDTPSFDGILISENLDKEKYIPYSKTGGMFLASFGKSVVPEMRDKKVYQLNYRWPALQPVYPMTRLIDEVVQIAEGIYLGQLVFATKHYTLGSLRLPFCSDLPELFIGDPYSPQSKEVSDIRNRLFSFERKKNDVIDYGYQNNGYFLMMDPNFATEIYADEAFPQLRPRSGESGYHELGYDRQHDTVSRASTVTLKDNQWNTIDWVNGWRDNDDVHKKFTRFILEPSPRESDTDVRELLRDGESILQMLKRISNEISTQSNHDDRLKHFEKLNLLFRNGVAPTIEKGLFQGHGVKGYNVRAEGQEIPVWYGKQEPCIGFDYYHGATLNLHLGFSDTLHPDLDQIYDDSESFPGALASTLQHNLRGPNVLNITWHSIGKYLFPWAGKSFEKISGRKLSMLLDESHDLAKRYSVRVSELKNYLASAPHYDLVLKNQNGLWQKEGPYGKYLQSGSWDAGMSDDDKAFWEKEANDHWIFGNNIEDERIVRADCLMKLIDMNYRIPDPSLQALSASGPSPFARQGYIFLGVSDRESILPMNNGRDVKKKVFQFHYRYPMIGGPAPIGFCLDEIVEIADGLYLGQLIYSTALHIPFHSSVDPSVYRYQLFGYFLLLDDVWQYHRNAIGLDVWRS